MSMKKWAVFSALKHWGRVHSSVSLSNTTTTWKRSKTWTPHPAALLDMSRHVWATRARGRWQDGIFFFFCVALMELKWAEVNCWADLDWESRRRCICNWTWDLWDFGVETLKWLLESPWPKSFPYYIIPAQPLCGCCWFMNCKLLRISSHIFYL